MNNYQVNSIHFIPPSPFFRDNYCSILLLLCLCRRVIILGVTEVCELSAEAGTPLFAVIYS